jgi:hypothetical protein
MLFNRDLGGSVVPTGRDVWRFVPSDKSLGYYQVPLRGTRILTSETYSLRSKARRSRSDPKGLTPDARGLTSDAGCFTLQTAVPGGYPSPHLCGGGGWRR